MTTVTCPEGHASTTTDYCDTCGAAIDAPASTGSAGPTPTTGTEMATSLPAGTVGTCPNCGTPRRADEAFCEVCGLDYATGDLPAVPAAPQPAAAPPSGWQVEIRVDPDWFARQEAESGYDLELPTSAAPRTVALTGDVATVGRRSDRDGWYPTVDLGHPVDDPACSRHHGEFRAGDDGWDYVDVGSTNGSTVDDVELAADTPAPLRDGTRIHLGAWTLLTVHAPDTGSDG